MSRRDSRVHIAVRQTDTLLELENFKKKFLFANKQITKQNCSLSLKIEELNAHISSLYVENLRLRASEIALQSQLKRERDKCQKIMADAEAATMNLLKHFGIIRESYNVPPASPPYTKDSDSPSPTIRKGPPPRSPSAPRLALQPSVPDIAEDPEEHFESSSEENGHRAQPKNENVISSATFKKPRKSASRLPVPSRVGSPPAPSNPPSNSLLDDAGSARKKKLSRRASGLMTVPTELPPRPPSPACGSSMHDDSELTDLDEDLAQGETDDILSSISQKEEELRKRKKERRSKVKEESDSEVVRERKERRKLKESDPVQAIKLKDVTNSPRRKRVPQLIESSSEIDNTKTSSEKSEVTVYTSAITACLREDRPYLPTPLPSTTNTPVSQHALLPTNGEENVTGRERRSRKSVNYAEPKLNTKMRKPDIIPPLSSRHSLPAISSFVVTPAQSPHPPQGRSSSESMPDTDEQQDLAAVRRTSSSTTLTKRKRSTKSLSGDGSAEEGDDDGGDADAEYSDFKSNWSGVSSRRKGTVAGVETGKRRHENEESRRHSIAV